MAGDADFSKVSLLLHMDGADGSTVITDSSQRPKTVTAVGDAKISTAQGLFGGASGYFDGSGDYLIFPHGPDFDFGTGAFTLEFFLYRAGGTLCVLVSSRESLPQGTKGQLEIGINANNTLYFHDGTNTFASSLSIQNNVWSHCAFCSSGNGQVSIFIGGALAFSGTCETGWTYTSNWMVGRWAGGAQYSYQGYLRELRITKGAARYTANFTPPTAPFGGANVVLSGLVTDASNAPAARLIRAYREDTGALAGSATSDAGSGAYSIAVDTSGAHTLNAYPAAGESLPTLTLRGVLPA